MKQRLLRYWAIAVGISIAFTVAYKSLAPARRELALRQAQDKTALIETDTGMGSGVFFKRGYHVFMWTAGHVVDGSTTVKVRKILRARNEKAGEMVFPAHVLFRFPDADTAVLLVEAPSELITETAEWTRDISRPGARVYTVGNYHGDKFDGSVSTGSIAQLGIVPPAPDWPKLDQAQLTVAPGSSGGGIFNDSNNLIGLTIGGMDAVGVLFFVPERIVEGQVMRIKSPWLLFPEYGCPPDRELKAIIAADEAEQKAVKGVDALLRELLK
jgi:S1-C subfamily serine protease